MILINIKVIEKFKKIYPTSRRPLDNFMNDIILNTFKNFNEIKNFFGKRIDKLPNKYGKNLYCFDIKANDFRLVAIVSFQTDRLQVNEVMTHKQYEKKYCSGK